MLVDDSLFRQDYSDEMIYDFLVRYHLSKPERHTQLVDIQNACKYFLHNVLSVYAFAIMMLPLDRMPLHINSGDDLAEKIVRWRLDCGC
jgi:hypothetical protein